MPDLDKLEALARAATPGPWTLRVHTHTRNVPRDNDDFTISGASGGAVAIEPPKWNPNVAADAQYIAAAHPDVILALIARVREVEAERDAADYLAQVAEQFADGPLPAELWPDVREQILRLARPANTET